MYYLYMCNELYSVSNCIDYARSAFMTRHVNSIYIKQVGNSREHAQNPCGLSGLIELEEKMAEFYVTE